MGTSDKGHTYVLILKDDFSGYVWLALSKKATAEITADTLIAWFPLFVIVSD